MSCLAYLFSSCESLHASVHWLSSAPCQVLHKKQSAGSESDHRFATQKKHRIVTSVRVTGEKQRSYKMNKTWITRFLQTKCGRKPCHCSVDCRNMDPSLAQREFWSLTKEVFCHMWITCLSSPSMNACTWVFLELHKKSTYLAEWEDAKMDKLEFAAPSIATTPLSCLKSCCCWSSLLLGSLLFCTHGNQKGTELQLHTSTIME